MQLREALKLAQSARKDGGKKAALLCSFEALHLKAFLQARLAERFPEGTPIVETFGFDQLRAAFSETSGRLRKSPAFLCLSWDDLHPALSWRSRAGLTETQDLAKESAELERSLRDWLAARAGAVTVVAPPPSEWLPRVGAAPPPGQSETALAAQRRMAELLEIAAQAGARVVATPARELNFRDLLLAAFPFTLEDADRLAETFVSAAFPRAARKKVLVVDLDETLWAGAIGDDGPEGVDCRAEGRGFPHHVFQKFLLKLRGEGAFLALCSKNNEGDVLPHFDRLALLKLADFSAVRVNWQAKSENLKSIARELNVGLDSLVFVDDNEAELAEVRQNAPEATALAAPREGAEWRKLFDILQSLFGTWKVLDEDRLRAEAPPRPAQTPAADSAAYLRGLDLQIAINRAAFSDPRSLELVNKTNQFNLTGERLSDEDWLTLSETPGAFCFSAKLKDRFGDFGTVGVVVGVLNGGAALVRQFVLSCRAFGRCVEAALLSEVAAQKPWVEGPFKKNGKNEPAELFLAGLGCRPAEGRWRLSADAAGPALKKRIHEAAAQVSVR